MFHIKTQIFTPFILVFSLTFLLNPSFAEFVEQDSLFLRLLQTIDVSPNDFSVHLNEEERDVFRLAIIDQLLTSSTKIEVESRSLLDTLVLSLNRFMEDNSRNQKPEWGELVREVLEVNRIFWKDFTESEKNEILNQLPLVYEESDELEDLDLFTLYEMREASADSFRKLTKVIKKIPSHLPWEKAFEKLLNYVLSIQKNENWDLLFPGLQKIPHPRVVGKTLGWAKTDFGDIVVGSSDDNIYFGDFAVIVDIGGNDGYFGRVASANLNCPVSFVLDFCGNDTYRSDSSFAFAGAINGISVLVDKQGNDHFIGQTWVQGAAICGIAALIDYSGFDTYYADKNGQGCAAFGKAILFDLGDNDCYQIRMYGQGVGLINGYGILYDKLGDDQYLATPRYTDVLRYQDHSLTLSQGFGYGLRPYFSGGIGILYDEEGSDLYVSDIYGQGSSYWYALGILWDKSGNDRYISYQYAQGAGIHISLGLLYDEAGDDLYFSKGVSQGCGHDLGCGWLRDIKGNDSYQCSELSQGAGSANGFGVMIDDCGNDIYVNRNSEMTLGFGNPRREYGSIGVFLDKEGEDQYSDKFAKDGAYWQRGIRGAGMDVIKK